MTRFHIVLLGDGWAEMNRHPRRYNITRASMTRLYRVCEATKFDYILTGFCTVYHVYRGQP